MGSNPIRSAICKNEDDMSEGAETTIERIIKPLVDTKVYKAGQTCWVLFSTGEPSVHVVGKYKGKGRYVTGWLHYPKQYDPLMIIDCEVTPAFSKKLSRL